MNLAITLLVAVSIASIIGTVLQQNQDYGDYVIKFGPFWFEVFRRLGLYDVYSSGWFLSILGFLVVSTSVCLVRHAPVMWREVTRYRDHVQATSLRVLRNHRSWHLQLSADETELVAARLMQGHSYRVRRKQRGETRVLAAMKGRVNRLGYVFTHLAIVVICVGALIDGSLPLKLREQFGDLRVETQNLPVSKVPKDSRLPVGTGAFRGSVTIPEGQEAGVVFLPLRDGYVVQDLPFDIRVDDFRIKHYPTGKPKSFESDISILDPKRDKPVTDTIRVNHPFTYKGYTIYQASFQDGGSRLDIHAWPLKGNVGDARTVDGRVFQNQPLQVAGAKRTLELTDFKMFNVRPNPEGVKTGRKFQNVGPSFTYKLRRPSGEAREFHNYMAPQRIDGASYYLSGVRSSPGESFRYLHIPADDNNSPRRFMDFLARLHDHDAVAAAAKRAASGLLADLSMDDSSLVPRVSHTAEVMIGDLLDGGFQEVQRNVRKRIKAGGDDDKRRQTLMNFSRMVLERTLSEVYRGTIANERKVSASSVDLDDTQRRFFGDALDAVSGIARYGAPVWLQLTGFKQRQAAGLQITRAPGRPVVLLGFGLLIAGVFLLFYVAHRRLWALVIPRNGYTELLLAGVSQRNPEGFRREFEALEANLDRQLDGDGESDRTEG